MITLKFSKNVMKEFENILLGVVFLTALIGPTTSLKCAQCFTDDSLCDTAIDCPAGKVCYTRKIRHPFHYMYDFGCALKEAGKLPEPMDFGVIEQRLNQHDLICLCGERMERNGQVDEVRSKEFLSTLPAKNCFEPPFVKPTFLLVNQYCSGGQVHGRHHGHGGTLLRRHEEAQCCDTGDMCNTHFTFASDITTTPAPFQLTSGMECQVCGGPTCGVKEDDPLVKCPQEFPYCMNVVLNEASGNKMVTKRCAKRSECQRENNSACVTFDPSAIYVKSMECIYCCETNGCNKDIVPRAETLIAR